jgi:hypothetical protein
MAGECRPSTTSFRAVNEVVAAGLHRPLRGSVAYANTFGRWHDTVYPVRGVLMQDSENLVMSREAKIVRDAVEKWCLPPNVRGFDIEFGEDSSGDPAVWIWLTIEDELKPSAQSISNLNGFVTNVRSDLLRRGPTHWPYVRYRRAA